MRLIQCIVSLTLVFAMPFAYGQQYPNKPIKIIVPYPAGQASDQITRMVAQQMSPGLGQPIVVDNKPGAGGNLGTEIGAKSPNDGYTLTIGTAALPISKLIYKKLNYDPIADFEPVTLMTTMPLVLVVSPHLKIRSVAELVEFAKKNPGKLNFASSGTGTSHQLAAEMFKQAAGIEMTHVAYKGSPPAHLDLMGGNVDLMFDNIVAVGPHIKSGKLTALAVTSKTRSKIFPDLPTIQESGYPGFEAEAWFGVLEPKGTANAITNTLNKSFVAALNAADIRKKLQEDGAQVIASSPEEFRIFLQNEIAKWSKVVSEARISLE